MMPTYDFRNKKTGEETQEFMAMDSREKYLEDNPDLEQVFNCVRVGDSVRLGITKPPAEFMKGVVQRIRDSVPGNNLKTKTKFQIPREF